MLRRLQLNIPNQYAMLEPSRAAELLFRSSQISAVGYDWVSLDKPPEGSIFLFATPPAQQPLPEDGYGWLDDESFQTVALENGVHVEVYSRTLGFTLQDAHATIERKRYRSIQKPDLQLLQYCRIPSDRPHTAIHPGAIRVHPRHPQQNQQSMAAQPSMLNPNMHNQQNLLQQQAMQQRMAAAMQQKAAQAAAQEAYAKKMKVFFN